MRLRPPRRRRRLACRRICLLLALLLSAPAAYYSWKSRAGPSLTAKANPSPPAAQNHLAAAFEFPFQLQPDPTVLITCFNSDCPSKPGVRAAHGYVLAQYNPKFVVWKSEADPVPANWSVLWAGTMHGSSRKVPLLDQGPPHLVMFVPGETKFAAKAGLWKGLVASLGREKAREICPETWVPPEDLQFLLAFAKAHPQAKLVFKFGHRQRNLEIVSASDARLSEKVLSTKAKVIQEMQPNAYLVDKQLHCAFRTYVHVRCGTLGQVSAAIDFNSPAYVNLDNTTVISSGYAASDGFATASTFLKRHLKSSQQAQVRAGVAMRVGLFLTAFGKPMCTFRAPEQQPRMQDLVTEMFGFDWLPTIDAYGGMDVKLLETNRFPDMQLYTPDQKGAKDVVKICTLQRRLGKVALQACPAPDQQIVTRA